MHAYVRLQDSCTKSSIMAKVLYQGHSYLSLLKCVHVYMCVYGG